MGWACEVISKGRLWRFLGDLRKRATRPEADSAALSQLPWLYTCAIYLTKDRQIAENLVQDTYRQARGRFGFRYQAGSRCRVWLLSILRKTFMRTYRKRIARPDSMDWHKLCQNSGSRVGQQWGRGQDHSQYFSITQFTDREVEEAIQKLPEENRLALILVDLEDLSYQEAATVMKCSLKTLRFLLSRGRWMLQLLLRNQFPPKIRVGETQ